MEDLVGRRATAVLPGGSLCRQGCASSGALDSHRIAGPKQDVIGIHLLQGVDTATIAKRLVLPIQLVAGWLAEAGPLIHEFGEGKQ